MSHYDPFADIPEAPVRPIDERPELERKGKKIPLMGEGVPNRKSSAKLKRLYEGLTRDRWRKEGYHVDRCSSENAYSGASHDLFGFADFAALGNGEAVLIQVCSKDGVSGHVRKFLTEDWAITNGNRYRTLESMRLALAAGVRIVIEGWHKPGRFWECHRVEVTPERLDEWEQKRLRRTG